MGVVSWWKNRNRPSAEERRARLLKEGRITEGTIMEIEPSDDGGQLMYFTYEIQGVDFESADLMTPEQVSQPAKYAPGATVNVRFDTKNYGNSVVE